MQKVLILDFGSQYTQLIARKVRETRRLFRDRSVHISAAKIREENPGALILSGGPQSVYERERPIRHKGIFDLDVPVLGICYGLQLMAHLLAGPGRPFRKTRVRIRQTQDPRPQRAFWPESGTRTRSG